LNEKLQDAYHKLLQAGVDKRESEREVKLKEVLNNLKRVFPGVHGRIVDLCQTTQHKYDTAVTTVLGRNLDAVVVEQEKTAIDCIEVSYQMNMADGKYMRNQRAGQATFIPLDTIQVKPVPDRLRSIVARGARLAIDCVTYNPAVERAIQHACSTSMICDTMDIARDICYEKKQEVKGILFLQSPLPSLSSTAVTLDGTVIHKSGLITGGQANETGRKVNDNEITSTRQYMANSS
jgi:structural maintenance of chromosome 1